jgi:hypothetical protein
LKRKFSFKLNQFINFEKEPTTTKWLWVFKIENKIYCIHNFYTLFWQYFFQIEILMWIFEHVVLNWFNIEQKLKINKKCI